MNNDYKPRIKYYLPGDLGREYMLGLALDYVDSRVVECLDFDDLNNKGLAINYIIELYNIILVINNTEFPKSWNIDDKQINNYKNNVNKFHEIIKDFFKSINDEKFINITENINIKYREDLVKIIDQYKIYKVITFVALEEYIVNNNISNKLLLSCKNIVGYYDDKLFNHIIKSNELSEILIEQYYFNKNYKEKNSIDYSFPKKLTKHTIEKILLDYLNVTKEKFHDEKGNIKDTSILNYSPINMDYVRIIAGAKTESTGLNKEIVLEAKKLCNDYPKKNEYVTLKKSHKGNFLIDLKSKSLELDLINAFKSILGQLNKFNCCSYIDHKKYNNIDKRRMRQKFSFNYSNFTYMASHVDTEVFYEQLLKNNINIESIFEWFYNCYILEKYSFDGFVVNLESENNSYLNKCKILVSEIESILNQYKCLVKYGSIERAYFETDYDKFLNENYPSFINNKYYYCLSDDIKNEIQLLFDNTGCLSSECLIDGTSSYISLYDSFNISDSINLNNYKDDYKIELLKWLENRELLFIKDNSVSINTNRASVLNKFNSLGFVTFDNVDGNDLFVIDKMIKTNDIESESCLFSRSELNYLRYILISYYSNSLEIRNKYCHGRYSLEEWQHYFNYIEIIKIFGFITLKIKAELDYVNGKE